MLSVAVSVVVSVLLLLLLLLLLDRKWLRATSNTTRQQQQQQPQHPPPSQLKAKAESVALSLILSLVPANLCIVPCLLPAWLALLLLCPAWMCVCVCALQRDVFISFIFFLYIFLAASSTSPAGALTMPDFMAYIEIMRRLLGNEFVCAADIVAIPKEADRYWINEHIRPHRPGEFSAWDWEWDRRSVLCKLHRHRHANEFLRIFWISATMHCILVLGHAPKPFNRHSNQS